MKDRSTAQSVIFLAPREAVCATTIKDILRIVHYEVMRQGAQLDDLRFVNVFVLGPKLELVIREIPNRMDFRKSCKGGGTSLITVACLLLITQGALLVNCVLTLGKVSRKNAAVLLDFVQMRGGKPCLNFLSPFHKCIFGQ